jgi:hypothetical protein
MRLQRAAAQKFFQKKTRTVCLRASHRKPTPSKPEDFRLTNTFKLRKN